MAALSAKVLVVDDDAAIRTLVSRLFERAGYSVRSAVDGADAIEQMIEDAPDLLILDLMMPRTDGIGVVEWIAKNAPPTRIIVLSAAVPGIVERLRKDIIWKILGKPFDLGNLLAEAEEALAASKPAAPTDPPA